MEFGFYIFVLPVVLALFIPILVLFVDYKWFSGKALLVSNFKEKGFDVKYRLLKGSITISSEDSDEWDWEIYIYFYPNSVYIYSEFMAPKGHGIFKYEPDKTFYFTTVVEKDIDFDHLEEIINNKVERVRDFFDYRLEDHQEKERIMRWRELHKWGEANRKMLHAFHVLENIPRLKEQVWKLRPILSDLRDLRTKELDRKQETELKGVDLKEIEDGPAAGYLVGVLPLEEGDIGGKESRWKGVLIDPETNEFLSQTTGHYEMSAFYATKEIAEVEIDQGILDPIQ